MKKEDYAPRNAKILEELQKHEHELYYSNKEHVYKMVGEMFNLSVSSISKIALDNKQSKREGYASFAERNKVIVARFEQLRKAEPHVTLSQHHAQLAIEFGLGAVYLQNRILSTKKAKSKKS